MNAYLAPVNLEEELKRELGTDEYTQHDRLFINSDINLITESDKFKPNLINQQKLNTTPIWSQLEIKNPKIVNIKSISDAANLLRKSGKFWAHYSFTNHRRCELIAQQLAKLKSKKINYLENIKEDKIGFWTLLDKDRLFYSPDTNSPFPLGEIHFNEDKFSPPSRAYLKLWELFTVHNIKPQKTDKVIDLGSSPGGWTWVLSELGCKVISVDKSPLDPKLNSRKNITFLKHDAFKLTPKQVGKVDWLFSDIICFPSKLYELVSVWQSSKLCKNIVCTIKFKGKTDFETIEKFKKIPGSKIIHLFHNKHELTFALISG